MTEKVLHGVVLVRWHSRYIDTHVHVVFSTVTLVHIYGFTSLNVHVKG